MSVSSKAIDLDARAFWVAAAGRGELRSEQLDAPKQDELLVRTVFSGISRGTEALVFTGQIPSSEYARMRAPFQSGDFPAPVKYGYANVGVVEHGPEHLRGRHVFTLYPHQTRFVVRSADVHLVPDDVPPERAVLTANMETALNGIWDGRPQVGDRVLVIGAGTVGCLVAWLAGRIPGTSVELVDINQSRATVARHLGVSFATPDRAASDVDIVFHASGSADGLNLAIDRAGVEATIIELSWYGRRRVDVELGSAFHARRLTIRSSQVGSIAPTQRPRYTTARRMEVALGLLAEGELDTLITGESMFDDLPSVMSRLATAPPDTICHRIRYS